MSIRSPLDKLVRSQRNRLVLHQLLITIGGCCIKTHHWIVHRPDTSMILVICTNISCNIHGNKRLRNLWLQVHLGSRSTCQKRTIPIRFNPSSVILTLRLR